MNHKKYIGYTLIEILVSLFIFAIISAVVLVGLRAVFESAKINAAHARELATLQKAMTLIERDAAQIIKRGITNDVKERLYSLEEKTENGQQIIEFTRGGYVNPKAVFNRSTLQRVAYSVVDGQLIRRTWPVLDRTDDTLLDSRVLLNNVLKIKWRFLDENNNFHTLWPPVSTMRSFIPKAFEMTLVINEKGEYVRLIPTPFMFTKGVSGKNVSIEADNE